MRRLCRGLADSGGVLVDDAMSELPGTGKVCDGCGQYQSFYTVLQNGTVDCQDCRFARWEQLARDGLERGNCILNFHKLTPSQQKEVLRFHGMMIEQSR